MRQDFFFERSGYKALAAGVVLQALKDVRKGDSKAAYWLEREGMDWYEFASGENVDPEFWIKWVRAGCPGKTSKPRKKGG